VLSCRGEDLRQQGAGFGRSRALVAELSLSAGLARAAAIDCWNGK